VKKQFYLSLSKSLARVDLKIILIEIFTHYYLSFLYIIIFVIEQNYFKICIYLNFLIFQQNCSSCVKMFRNLGILKKNLMKLNKYNF